MKIRTLFTVGFSVILGAVQAGAEDIAAGETLYQDVCKNCHGPKAQGMASFPKLANKDVEYLIMRLEQYRAEEHVGPNSPLMIPLAIDLTNEEIVGRAAYITTGFE